PKRGGSRHESTEQRTKTSRQSFYISATRAADYPDYGGWPNFEAILARLYPQSLIKGSPSHGRYRISVSRRPHRVRMREQRVLRARCDRSGVFSRRSGAGVDGISARRGGGGSRGGTGIGSSRRRN